MLPKEHWRRNRLAINLAAGFLFAGFTFAMPFLPLYVRELGVRDDADVASWSGLLITVAPLIAGFLGPPEHARDLRSGFGPVPGALRRSLEDDPDAERVKLLRRA